jgi:hypothetical protein
MKNLFEITTINGMVLANRFVLLVQGPAGESQTNQCRLARCDIDMVVRSDLGTLLCGIHRSLVAAQESPQQTRNKTDKIGT